MIRISLNVIPMIAWLVEQRQILLGLAADPGPTASEVVPTFDGDEQDEQENLIVACES